MALFGRQTQRDEQRAVAYARWMQARNPFAIASVVLGVFSLIEFGALFIFGIAGIVLGAIALRQIKTSRQEGRSLAWAGIVTSVVSIVIATFLYARVFG